MRGAIGTRSAGAANSEGSVGSIAAMKEPVRARMWETGGRWYARILDAPLYVEVTGVSRERCLSELWKVTGEEPVTVEVIPQVVGVAEAAEIMGWDKRRVVTYIDRGSFPEPLTALASGRIWLREDVETYARAWRARRAYTPADQP
jgi:hypothetical protein